MHDAPRVPALPPFARPARRPESVTENAATGAGPYFPGAPRSWSLPVGEAALPEPAAIATVPPAAPADPVEPAAGLPWIDAFVATEPIVCEAGEDDVAREHSVPPANSFPEPSDLVEASAITSGKDGLEAGEIVASTDEHGSPGSIEAAAEAEATAEAEPVTAPRPGDGPDAAGGAWPHVDEAATALRALLPASAEDRVAGGAGSADPASSTAGAEVHAAWDDDDGWDDDIMPALPTARPDGAADVAWAHAFGTPPASSGSAPTEAAPDGSAALVPLTGARHTASTETATIGVEGTDAERTGQVSASAVAPSATSDAAASIAARIERLASEVRDGALSVDAQRAKGGDAALVAELLAALLRRGG